VPQPDAAQVVFLVENDSSIQRSFSTALEVWGFNVMVFTQPEAFLSHIATHRVQVVVLDIWMQLTTGIDLLAYLYACSPQTRTIFITGTADENAESILLSSGAFAFLPKPVNDEEFLDAVHRAFGEVAAPLDEKGIPSFY
jgi:FixJ family two-component response regulator